MKKLLVRLLPNRQKNPINHLPIKEIRSILLRPLGYAIGDATVHTAHLAQLRTIFPNAKIGVIVKKSNETIFKSSGLVDVFVEHKYINYVVQHKKWDLLLDFENNFNSASLLADWLLMPKWIMIFRKYNKRHYHLDNIKNYDFHCNQSLNAPLSHFLNNSIFTNYVSVPEPYSVLHTSDQTQKKMTALWQLNKIRVLLCPQGSQRELPPNELAELLNQSISTQMAKHIQCILGYTPTAENYQQALAQQCTIHTEISPQTSLAEYLALINSADIVIAVDGGSLHLACAFKKPLLSFFANSEPNLGQWQPLIYPNISHLRLVTKENKGTNSNSTEGFDLTEGIKWLQAELLLRTGRKPNSPL